MDDPGEFAFDPFGHESDELFVRTVVIHGPARGKVIGRFESNGMFCIEPDGGRCRRRKFSKRAITHKEAKLLELLIKTHPGFREQEAGLAIPDQLKSPSDTA